MRQIPRPAVAKPKLTIVKRTVKVNGGPQIKMAPQVSARSIPKLPVIAQKFTRTPPVRSKPVASTKITKASKGKKKPTIQFINREVSRHHKDRIISLRNGGSGRSLAIIANGPSVSEVDFTRLLSHPRIDFMSINKPDKRIWPTKYWLFCDDSQRRRHPTEWSTYNGIILNTNGVRAERPNSIRMKNIGGQGFSLNVGDGLHVGRSSSYAAMQVALWIGYEHIFLFGVDMAAVRRDGQLITHYYGNNPDVQPDERIKRFDKEAKFYEHAARVLPQTLRNRFVFCSSYLKYDFAKQFGHIGHEEAVSHILGVA